MNLEFFTHKRDAKTIFSNKTSSYYLNRIGFWAEVKEVDSTNNWVNVVSEQGLVFNSIPVASREWVNDNNKYITSERFLPPVGARVFVLTPTHSITGAFVLCSGYPRGEDSLKTLFAQSNDEKELKNNQYEKISQGGWNIKENYEDGNILIESNDKEVSISLNLQKNDNLKQKQCVSITAWKNSINIADKKIDIQDSNQNKINFSDSGATIQDKNSNKIEMSSSGITIQDKNRNKIEMTGTSTKINGNLEVTQ